MAKITSRKEFREYCLRKLGWPVVDINVSEEQVDDRIDDALQLFQDYHFDGTEKIFMKHKITQDDIDRRWIYCPDAVSFVTGIIPFMGSSTSANMFDLRYQLRLHDLYDFTSVSYVSYEITMQHIRTLNLLFSGTPQFRFNRKLNRIFLDINWDGDVKVGSYVIIECYRSLNPENVILTGTLSGNTSSNTLTGYSTLLDQEILENDFIKLSDGQNVQVRHINNPTELVLSKPLSANVANVTFMKEGISDVWNDRFFKAYATAKIKYQYGQNVSKYQNIQMPGGVMFNGERLIAEAKDEMEEIEEKLMSNSYAPNEFFTG